MAEQKRIGRPTKQAPPGSRVSLGLKVTSETKNALERAANASGRTQSQEAELRIEQTFRDESLLAEVLELKFGRPLAGLVLAVAWAMQDAGREAVWRKSRAGRSDPSWAEDPYAFEQALAAALTVLRSAKPPGEEPTPDPHWDNIGEGIANGVIEAIRGNPILGQGEREAAPIRDLLGDLAKRMEAQGQTRSAAIKDGFTFQGKRSDSE